MVTSITTLYIISFFLPSVYKTKDSIVIHAKSDSVFSYLIDIKKWKDWSFWIHKNDPNVEFVYEGNPIGNGSIMRWKNTRSGAGKLQIIETWEPSFLKYNLQKEYGEQKTTGSFELKETGGNTSLIWTNEEFIGSDPFSKYTKFFLSYFEKSKFKQSLHDIKKEIEKN